MIVDVEVYILKLFGNIVISSVTKVIGTKHVFLMEHPIFSSRFEKNKIETEFV